MTQELNSLGTRVAANHLLTRPLQVECVLSTVSWTRKHVELRCKNSNGWQSKPRGNRRIWYLDVTPSFVWQELHYLDKSQTNQKEPVISSGSEHQPDTLSPTPAQNWCDVHVCLFPQCLYSVPKEQRVTHRAVWWPSCSVQNQYTPLRVSSFWRSPSHSSA